MYKNEFDRVLKSGNIPRAVMLYGDSEFLIELYKKKYLDLMPSDLSVLKLYHSEYSLDLASSHLGSPSLFDSGNLLVIKYDKKLDAKNINALLDLVEKSEQNYLLLQYEAEDGKAKASYFEKRKLPAVRFFEPNFFEAKNLLKEVASLEGILLNDEALDLILNLSDYNLSFATSELEKIKILDDKSTENIKNIVAGHLAVDPFKIIIAMVEKKEFLHMIENLYLDGIEEYKIVLDLQKAFLQLFGLFASKKLFGSGATSRDFLGYMLPAQLEKERTAVAIRLTLAKYTAIFETLNELERELKSKNIGNKQALLHAYLIKLQREIG